MNSANSALNLGFYRPPALQKHEFLWIRDYLYKESGIVLNDSKLALVAGRLDKRLRFHGLNSYSEYFGLLGKPGFEEETTLAVDLLTTNETYFFREPKHFDFLNEHFFPHHTGSRVLRFWSAACSSGEEAYTLAMLAAEFAHAAGWEILATDLSFRVLEKARRGLYPLSAAENIPAPLLKKYCRKGQGQYEGFLLIDGCLRRRVDFRQLNLNRPFPEFGNFDVIFLRNVMIYFDMPTKQRLVDRIQRRLRPGGYLIISHSESLNGIPNTLRMLAPSIYHKDD